MAFLFMGKFIKENQFWLKRTKHGREKIFATPEILWDAICEYFRWVSDNPYQFTEQKRIGARKKKGRPAHPLQEIPHPRPFTMGGLCIFLDVTKTYFTDFRQANEKTINSETATEEAKKLARDFSSVIAMSENVVTEQKFGGASVGIFNAQLISRDLGLIDRRELEHKGIPDIKTTYILERANDDDE